MDHHASRRDRLLRTIKDESLDGVLVTTPVNVTYLSGFSGDSSYLILSPAKTILVSDGRFTQQLAEECPGLETFIRKPAVTVAQAAAGVLHEIGLRAVGCESGHLTLAELQALADAAPAVSWKPGRDRVEQLRQVKDADEIAQIRAAIRSAERAFAMFRACLRGQDTEKELADAMEMYVRRAGGAATAFPPIVGIGDRSALPHAPLTNRRLDESSLVLVDWGASGRFYKSDLTRVLLTRNNCKDGPPALFEEVYTIVLEAQKRALAAVRPGVKAAEVDAVARAYLAQAGYGEQFNHSLGHGFGLVIHEGPFLKPGAETVLQPGMVVTLEPGVYLAGRFGVRIEDDVLVTPDGAEVLSSLPRDLAANIVDL